MVPLALVVSRCFMVTVVSQSPVFHRPEGHDQWQDLKNSARVVVPQEGRAGWKGEMWLARFSWVGLVS